MQERQSLFDLSGSYLEIGGWVIINFNRETGSIHEYEDFELSAESFLMELNTLKMFPSPRMPVPSTKTATEFENNSKV